MNKSYDTIVIGAGPGGSATAYYLAQAGLEVLLLDKFDFPRDKTCGDGLTPLALAVLQDMGILEKVHQVGRRVNKLEIIAPNGFTLRATIPTQDNRANYSLIVPRLKLDDAVRERAVSAGAAFRSRVQVTSVEADGRGVVITGGRGRHAETFRARSAVVATGASTNLLLAMGLLPERPAMMVAARTYFENVAAPADCGQFYFSGVPLPGYGWVFPLPDGGANVGAGFFRQGRFADRMPATPTVAFEQFIQQPALRSILADARQVGPVKGYPLRIDFSTAPTFGPRTLLVGEAAGLVNPLTGEGIDYALRSGQIAAQCLIEMAEADDFSPGRLTAYDQALRREFQGIFRFCRRMQSFLPYRSLVNRLVKGAAQQPELRNLMINIVQGQHDLSQGLSRRLMLKGLFTLALADFR
jgi:geranylgeranyl reductase family protein